jgi:hypothetical protein
VPLASRHGLLLVRLDSGPIVAQLAVCSLHVGTCHVLPTLSSRYLVDDMHDVNGYAVLTAADCRLNDDHDKLPPPQSHPSPFFKVVIIGRDQGRYHLHALSSREGSWRVRVDCFKSTALPHGAMAFCSDVVVRGGGGSAHWFFGNWIARRSYVASINTQTEQLSLTMLPFPLSPFPPGYHHDRSRQCLVLAHGEALWLLRMKETGPLVEIWGQQPGEQHNVADGTSSDSEWLCTRMVELKKARNETQKRELWLLAECSGTLLVTDNRQRVYTADLETGMMKRVVDWPRRRDVKPGEVVPLEMDWAAFFLSRLGNCR